MALYRCAACGSPNVVTDTQKGELKYNYWKGAVGTAVLGGGGAVAGVTNKTEHVFKCPDCGITLTYPMDAETCAAINMGVASAEARNNLTLHGLAAPWEFFTSKYKNIEKGYADYSITDRASKVEETLKAKATATQEEFDEAVAILARIQDAKYSENNPMPKEVYDQGKTAIYTFIENLYCYLPPERLKGAELSVKYKGLSVGKSNLSTYLWDYLLFWYQDNIGGLALKSRPYHSSDIQLCTFAKVFVEKYQECMNDLRYYDDKDYIAGRPPAKTLTFDGRSGSFFWVPLVGIRPSNILPRECISPYAYPRFTYHGNDAQSYFKHSSDKGLGYAFSKASLDTYIEAYLAQNPHRRATFDRIISERTAELQQLENCKKEAQEFAEKQSGIIAENNARIAEATNQITALSKKIFGKAKAQAEMEALKKEIRALQENNKSIEQAIKEKQSTVPQCRSENDFSFELYARMGFFMP